MIAFVITLLIVGRVIFIPLSISFLFAIVLNPLLKRLERTRLNRVFSISIVMLAFVVLLTGFIAFSSYQIGNLVADLPNIESKVLTMLEKASDKVSNTFSLSLSDQENIIKSIRENTGTYLASMVSTTSSFLTILVQIPIYIFLILLYKNKFRAFVERGFHKTKAETETGITEVKDVIQGYVFGMFLVICVLAILNSIGLLLLGIDYAIFFGVLSAVLTVIPYIGNFIGGFFPFLIAIVTKDSMWYAVGVVAVYAVIQFLEGNFITPNIMSSRVSINPLVALLALIAGGQILGIAGLILAIPVVGILKVLFNHSQTLKPLVVLMEE